MSYVHLLVERDDGILTLVVNRPRVPNALNAATSGELHAVVAGGGMPPRGAGDDEATPCGLARTTDGRGEGTEAFRATRRPDGEGR